MRVVMLQSIDHVLLCHYLATFPKNHEESKNNLGRDSKSVLPEYNSEMLQGNKTHVTNGGEAVSLSCRLRVTSRNIFWNSFLLKAE
jgi:hypothetical protein